MKKKLLVGTAAALVFVCICFGIRLYASKTAKERIDMVLEKNAKFLAFDYKDVTVDLIGRDVRISDVRISPPDEKEKLRIREIIIHEFDDKSDIPLFLSISFNGLELNPDKFGTGGENIRKLGYADKLLVSLKADYVYEKERKELNIEKMGLRADDVGEISISLHVGNIDLSPENFMAILFTFPQITVHKAEIVYKDDSLAERSIRFAAKEKNMEADKFKSVMIQELEKEIEKEKNDSARNLLVKIRNFLNDPKELSISFTPESPSLLGEIMDEFQQSVSEHENLFRILSGEPEFESKQKEPDCNSKQSEIKRVLRSLATFEEAYRMEYDTYTLDMEQIGFRNGSEYYDVGIEFADEDTWRGIARSKAPGISGGGAGDDVWVIDMEMNPGNLKNGCR